MLYSKIAAVLFFWEREMNVRSFFGSSCQEGPANVRLTRHSRRISQHASTPNGNHRQGLPTLNSTPTLPPRNVQRRQLGYQPGMVLSDHPMPSPHASGNMENSDSDFELAGDEASFEQDCAVDSNGVFQLGLNAQTEPTPLSISSSNSYHQQPSNADHSMFSMLQQQQAMLAQLLQKQDTMDREQAQMKKKLEQYESKVSSPTSSETSSGKRSRIVSRTLSNKVSMLHKANAKQFDPEQSSTSLHNMQVKDLISKEILLQPDCKYDKKVVKAAVKRCYENTRRNFMEQKEGREDYVYQQAKRRKYRSRRQRKFDKRSSVVTEGERAKYWKFLSYAYMTEESDDPEDENTIIEHKLSWRSQKLDEYIKVLDSRYEDHAKKGPVVAGIVAKKVRKLGSPSASAAPKNAQPWSVAKERTNPGISDTTGSLDLLDDSEGGN